MLTVCRGKTIDNWFFLYKPKHCRCLFEVALCNIANGWLFNDRSSNDLYTKGNQLDSSETNSSEFSFPWTKLSKGLMTFQLGRLFHSFSSFLSLITSFQPHLSASFLSFILLYYIPYYRVLFYLKI